MPYVGRDAHGNINGLFANPQDFTKEFLPDTDPTVVAFLTPNPVPQSVTQRQARIALSRAGLLGQLQSAINTADAETQITWEYASVIHRDDPVLAAMAAKLNLTSAQIDQLFATAATI
jgi:hypothetical protein